MPRPQAPLTPDPRRKDQGGKCPEPWRKASARLWILPRGLTLLLPTPHLTDVFQPRLRPHGLKTKRCMFMRRRGKAGGGCGLGGGSRFGGAPWAGRRQGNPVREKPGASGLCKPTSFSVSGCMFWGLGPDCGVSRSSVQPTTARSGPTSLQEASLHHTDHIPPGRLGNPTGPRGVWAPSPSNRWCPPFRPHLRPLPGTLLHREESSEQRARSPGAAPG